MSDLEVLESALSILDMIYTDESCPTCRRTVAACSACQNCGRTLDELWDEYFNRARDLFKQQQDRFAQRGDLLEAVNLALEENQRRYEWAQVRLSKLEKELEKPR